MKQIRKISIQLLFVVGVLLCYRQYITGNVCFVFKGIADDSFWQTYPNLYSLANKVENGIALSGYDFTKGYGAARDFTVYNLFNWVILFGTNMLPYLMGISQIAKVFLSYMIFYYYLKILRRSNITCYIGAASYALCGHMMIRQFWNSYPNEVVLTAFVLLCLEMSISKKNYKWLPLSLVLYCISLGGYKSVYLFALVIGYSFVRYFESSRCQVKSFIKSLIVPISAYLVALTLSALFLIRPLIESFTSPRLKRAVAVDTGSRLALIDLNMVKLAIARTVSNDWAGTNELNIPGANLLTAPSFFCGIMLLIMFLFAIYMLKGRRRIVAVMCLLASLLYISFPTLRKIMNGFSSDHFKLSSFWITLLIIYYGTLGLDLWIESRNKINYSVVVITIVIIGVVTVLRFTTQDLNMTVYVRIMLTLLLYAVFFLYGWRVPTKYFGSLLVLLVFSDLFANAYSFCNSDMAVKREVLDEYNDSAIERVKALDMTDFYRIEKKYDLEYRCASMIQDYYGLNDYTGGTSMNDKVHDFLEQMNIPKANSASRHCMSGLSNANTLYDILGVKYILSKELLDNNYGLEFICEVDGTSIYENKDVLPIGFGYNKIISKNEFQKMDIESRRVAILDCCVLDSDNSFDKIVKSRAEDYEKNITGEELAYQYDSSNNLISFDKVDSNTVLVLKSKIKGTREWFDELVFGVDEDNYGRVKIGLGESINEYYFVFTGNDISYIKFGSAFIESLSDIHLLTYDKKEYNSKTDQYIHDRKENIFECSRFSDNLIEGTFNNQNDAILFFSIPYDEGWSIYIDGQESDLLEVNFGFAGTYVSKGEHNIILQYKVPYRTLYLMLSVIGMLSMVCWNAYWNKHKQ